MSKNPSNKAILGEYLGCDMQEISTYQRDTKVYQVGGTRFCMVYPAKGYNWREYAVYRGKQIYIDTDSE